jgi:nitrite reductase (NADH) small subunit
VVSQLICRVTDIPPGTGRLFPIGPFGVGVFNVAGRFYALANYCPHRGGPLCLGKVTGTTDVDDTDTVRWIDDGEVIRCPWHGWEFSISEGRTITKPVRRVHMYPVRAEGNDLMIDVPTGPA